MNKKIAQAEEFTRRFYLLNFCVTILLLISIFISIEEFGGEAWQGRKQAALILPGEKERLGWDRSQYIALKNVCDEMDYDLILREDIPEDYESCRKVVDELVRRGIGSIYFTNGCRLSDIAKIEHEYPKVTFCTIESISALWLGGRCSILSFEGSYLAGILAGLHTKTNKVGYVAPFQESEINQGINAFTMGVKRVNPNAEVLLNWTASWDNPKNEEQAVQSLKANRVDVLTYHQNGETVPNSAKSAGIYFVSFNEVYPDNNYCLGAIRIDWTKIYRDLFRYREGHEFNYHYAVGMANNTVNLELSKNVTMREKVAVESAKWELKHGRIIFMGDIFDRYDTKKCSANEAISLQSLNQNMDWLIKGVRIVGN